MCHFPLPDFDCRCLNVLSDIEVCEQDVIDIISTLNVDKAVKGFTNISEGYTSYLFFIQRK
jgi:hypothetical protein